MGDASAEGGGATRALMYIKGRRVLDTGYAREEPVRAALLSGIC